MDFFDHQDRARRKSGLLVFYFGLAVLGVVVSVYVAAVIILAMVHAKSNTETLTFQWWYPELFVATTASVLSVIALGSFYKIAMLSGGGESVALALGGRKVPANTRDLAERILLNVVEEMALASGTPVPPVYIMDDEEGINAFAAGTTPQNAVIGITRGAILTLKRDELQGVIAHEFSHILNGDMRLNIRLMGLLHGILVLALIGYMILRTVGHSSGRVSTRRSNDDNKGAGGLILAILAAGVALLAIGYIGVFFAQLIKSAVSRQREFLADASAVQFTRNPSGIADALKRIGGWAKSSKISSPRAEESSHMFFGSAMVASLFSTHPPLAQRILRIDPNFQGTFPESGIIQHDPSEIIDPRSLSLQRSSFQAAHQAAVDGAESLRKRSNEVAESVGEPRPEHIDHVHGLVDGIDPILAEDVRDPLGAVAVIYGLLLASPDSPLRETQLELLKNRPDSRPFQELQRILSSIDCLASEQRLPMVSLALPALHQMSAQQIQAFYMVVRELIQIDQNITIFEYAVHRYIAKRLLPRLRPESAIQPANVGWSELQKDFLNVLEFLARLSDSKRVEDAFQMGLSTMGLKSASPESLRSKPPTFRTLDQSLDRLAGASSQIKKQMLLSFSACIAEDQHVSIEEAELLRVIADALGCPVPPILR